MPVFLPPVPLCLPKRAHVSPAAWTSIFSYGTSPAKPTSPVLARTASAWAKLLPFFIHASTPTTQLNQIGDSVPSDGKRDNFDERSDNGLCMIRDGLGARVYYGRGSLVRDGPESIIIEVNGTSVYIGTKFLISK